MPADPKLLFITSELDLGFAFARTAQTAYSSGRIEKSDVALQEAWTAWHRAARLIAEHKAETLHPRLLELETLLETLEGKLGMN